MARKKAANVETEIPSLPKSDISSREREYVSLEGGAITADMIRTHHIPLPTWPQGEQFRWMELADLHVGCYRGPMKLVNSLARHKLAFDEFIVEVKKYKPHAVLIAGDIWHFKEVYEAERKLFTSFLSELLQLCAVVLQPGNHDFIQRGVSNLSSLQTMADHGIVQNLYLASTEPQYLVITNGHDQIKIYNACCEIPLLLSGVRWADIVMYHGNVAGSKFDNGHDPSTEANFVETRIRLPYSEARLWVLGDIHLRQQPAPNAHYVGAILQTKFSEDDDKGHVEGFATFDEKGVPIDFEWKYKILHAAPKMITIVVKNEDSFPTQWPENCYIRLQYGTLHSLPLDLPGNVIKVEAFGSTKFVNTLNDEDSDAELDVGGDMHLSEDTEEEIMALLTLQQEVQLLPGEAKQAADLFLSHRLQVTNS